MTISLKNPLVPALREFMWDIHRSEGDTVRTRDDRTTIVDVGRPNEDWIENPTDRENECYNYGVIAGSLALTDYLYDNGYTILDPAGIQIERPEGKTFLAVFAEHNWAQVSDTTDESPF